MVELASMVDSAPQDELPAVVVKTVYLAHPYAMKDDIAVLFQPTLEAIGLRVVNPFDRPQQAEFETAMRASGLTRRMCDDIVRMDLEKIDEVDAVVAVLDGANSPGTLMEIFYAAHVRRIPVFTHHGFDTYGGKNRKHPWIRSLTVICPDQTVLVTNLKRWINGR